MSRYLRNAFIPPLALATILAGGALVVWTIAIGFVGALIIARSLNGRMNEHLQILNNGQALIFVPQRMRGQSTYTYLTLDHQVTTLDAVVGEERTSSQPASLGQYMVGSGHLRAPGDVAFRSEIASRRTICGVNDGTGAGGTYWYIVREKGTEGRTFFEGFDSRSRHRVGYLGRSGFRLDPPPPDDQFVIGARSLGAAAPGFNSVPGGVPRMALSANRPAIVAVMSEDQLYLVNLTARSVKHVPLSEPVVAVTIVDITRQSYKVTDQVVVRTPEHILLLDQDGNTLRTLSIPAALVDEGFTVSLPRGDNLIVHSQPALRQNELYWIDADDKVVRHETFELRGSRDTTRAGIITAITALPSPAVLTVIGYLMWLDSAPTKSKAIAAHYARNMQLAYFAFAIVCVVSAALAAIAYRRQRRYGPGRAIPWAIFVFLLGPAGLFGYLVHRHWPVVEQCVACGAQVPRDRGACQACQADFPAPALVGGEVFA